jgi:hypothetical protein
MAAIAGLLAGAVEAPRGAVEVQLGADAGTALALPVKK